MRCSRPSSRPARQYRKAIDAAPDSPAANDARIELAEMLAARADNDPSIDLLLDALEHDPRGELEEKVKLRLAACFLGRHEPKQALAQFRPPGADVQLPGPDSRTRPRAPPCPRRRFIDLSPGTSRGRRTPSSADWPKAIEQLLAFRDADPYRGAPDVVDRALLRLGHAYAPPSSGTRAAPATMP